MSSIPPSDGPSAGYGPSATKQQAETPQIVVQPQVTAFGRYGKLLLILLAFAVMSIIGLVSSYQSYFSPPGGPQEKYHSLSREAQQKNCYRRGLGHHYGGKRLC